MTSLRASLSIEQISTSLTGFTLSSLKKGFSRFAKVELNSECRFNRATSIHDFRQICVYVIRGFKSKNVLFPRLADNTYILEFEAARIKIELILSYEEWRVLAGVLAWLNYFTQFQRDTCLLERTHYLSKGVNYCQVISLKRVSTFVTRNCDLVLNLSDDLFLSADVIAVVFFRYKYKSGWVSCH